MKQKKIFALGFFDGVHLGHQALLSQCVQLAKQEQAMPVAVTFNLPPSAVLHDLQPNMINTRTDRQSLLLQHGAEEIHVITATKSYLSYSWQDFLQTLLVRGAAGFVCGEDYRFGRGGEGTAQKLSAFAAERGLPCVILPEQTMDGEKISSTRIRTLLERGDVENANRMLGHPHIFTGKVVSGQKIGRTIGVPTANLKLPRELVTPAFGVYACTTILDGKKYLAVTNIGTRPTVNGNNVTVEPWILDFDGDLYGKEITLHFHNFLRPERKFDSLEELKAQIQRDAAKTRTLLK